jgi:hypothetical protein
MWVSNITQGCNKSTPEWYINKTWRKGFNVGLFKVVFGEKTLYYLDVFTTGGITGNNYPDKAAGALQINVLK